MHERGNAAPSAASSDDLARLDAWLAACARSPGALPADVTPVQTRLIRAVGRGVLPSGRAVYLKTMGFPRLRDRVRYLFRALPAVHEARLLERLAQDGVACPTVERVVGSRRYSIPHLSVLVTNELPLAASTAVDFRAAAECLARLARRGVFHPDPNRGNFVALRGEAGVAVLDLQSARLRRRPLTSAARRHMAAKLMLDFATADEAHRHQADALVQVGLVSADEVVLVQAAVQELRAAERRRRVRRCLTTSTEFVVERRFMGTVHRRRALAIDGAGIWLPHREARQLWIGDRVAELFDGVPPQLGAMFHKSWWRPGLSAVYIPGGDGTRFSSEHAPRLLAAARRFESLE